MAPASGFSPFVALALKAAKGEVYVPAKGPNNSPGQVPADDISDLLRGVVRTDPSQPAGFIQPVAVRALRIQEAEIIGSLDLSGRRDKPFPPIEFVDCNFSEINFSGAWFSWITFTGCKLAHLLAKECRVDGSFDLKKIRSSSPQKQINRSDVIDKNESSTNTGGNNLSSENLPSAAVGYGRCWIELQNAFIGGNLAIISCRLYAPPKRHDLTKTHELKRYALNLSSARIEGTFFCTPGVHAIGGISLGNAHISGDVWMSGAEFIAVEGYALFAQNCHIRANLVLSEVTDKSESKDPDSDKKTSTPFRSRGTVQLFGSNIDGVLHATGALIQQQREEEEDEKELYAIEAPYLKVLDHVSISASTVGPANFAHAQIGADCSLNLAVTGNLWAGRATNQPLFNFENAELDGRFDINELKFNDPLRRLSDLLGRIIKDLKDERVALLEDWIASAKVHHLKCYSELCLLEISISPNMTKLSGYASSLDYGTVSLLWDGRNGAVPLDGFASRFHDLNNLPGVLKLTSNEEAIDYLCLFSSNISGSEGPFFILRDTKTAGKELQRILDGLPRPIKAVEQEDAFEIDADVLYGAHLFRSKFKVHKKNGRVEMKEDTPVTDSLVLTSTYFDRPFRRDFDKQRNLPSLFSENWEDLPIARAFSLLVTAVNHHPSIDQRLRARFNLTGATVKRLEDRGGTEVGDSVILQLGAFQYAQMDLYAPHTLKKWRWLRIVELAWKFILLAKVFLFSLAKNFWTNLKEPIKFFERLPQMLFAPQPYIFNRIKDPSEQWQRRLNWLALQYNLVAPGSYRIDSDTYIPQPYDQLAAAYRLQGEFIDSRKILSHKLTLERHFKPNPLFRFTWWLYWLGFDYGLSAGRALITLALYVLVGIGVACYANNHGFLVTDVPRAGNTTTSMRCTEGASPVDVADAFISFLDLKLESKCHIRSFDNAIDHRILDGQTLKAKTELALRSAAVWKISQTCYGIFGAILFSLGLITFTGVARRHIEK